MSEKILFGPEDKSGLPLVSCGKILLNALKSYPKTRTALVDLKTGQSLTYGDLVNFSVNLAGNLRNLIGRNDVIAVISENSHWYIVPLLAGLLIGTPVHLLNPGYTTYELGNSLQDSRPKILFVSRKCLETVSNLKLSNVKIVVMEGVTDGNDVISLQDWLQSGGNDNFEDFDVDERIAVIFNSSGTTGLPKGVQVTHAGFRIDFMHCLTSWIHVHEQDETLVLVVPFFHLYGMGILKVALFLGSTVYIMDQFNPYLYLETIQTYRIAKLFTVPTLVNFLANSPLVDKYDLSCVKDVVSAAAPPCEEIQRIVIKKFNLKTIRQVYGLTELSSGVCFTPLNEFREKSCGKLCPKRQLKILDIETGAVLGVNQSGEICVKGGVMRGYINREEEDFQDFFRTGDVGYYDEDGFVYVIDRIKDLIKFKSFQVPPLELENILLQHPAVAEVGVVGKVDEKVGELAMAFILKKAEISVTETEIIHFVAERVCYEKRLHGGVRFVEQMPKNQLGKILKKKLKEMI